MAEQLLLEVEGVARHFSGVQAVNGATLAVPEGLITGLIGPNGAGKSTLVGIIAGVVAADAGRVVYRGADITGLAPHLRARRGLIRTFQSSSEFGRLTVLENLVVAGQAQRGESFMRALVAGRRSWVRQERAIVRRAHGLLARFELEAAEDEYAENLSGGQKRILELMRALMADPKLLVLDEPMAGVSPSIAPRIEHYLEMLRTEGLTMLMVEHEMGIVERLCDRILVMAQGRVIAEGSMAEVRSSREVQDAYAFR